jgi:hypothetical protein
MAINPVLSAGLSGLNASIRGTASAAHDIATQQVPRAPPQQVAKAPENGQDSAASKRRSLDEALVDLKLYEHQGKASVEVIQAADELLGTLLDELA